MSRQTAEDTNSKPPSGRISHSRAHTCRTKPQSKIQNTPVPAETASVFYHFEEQSNGPSLKPAAQPPRREQDESGQATSSTPDSAICLEPHKGHARPISPPGNEEVGRAGSQGPWQVPKGTPQNHGLPNPQFFLHFTLWSAQ